MSRLPATNLFSDINKRHRLVKNQNKNGNQTYMYFLLLLFGQLGHVLQVFVVKGPRPNIVECQHEDKLDVVRHVGNERQ